MSRHAAKFASKQHIVDWLGQLKERCGYILFKDHQEKFQDRKQARQINPTNTELGLVSKDLMERITSTILRNP